MSNLLNNLSITARGRTRQPEPDDNLISKVLTQRDRRPEAVRLGDEFIHVTSLLDFCPRQHALAELSNKSSYNTVTGGHRVMWKIGRAVEEHVRSEYIQGVDFKGVVGSWSCLCGHTKYSGEYLKNKPSCSRCRGKVDIYEEKTLFDLDAKISGNPDMVIKRNGKYTPIEIKSIKGDGSDGFEAMDAPKPDHVFQVSAYRKMLKDQGKDVTDEVIIIYVNKRFKFGSPYKEYHVDASQDHIQNLLNIQWEAVRSLRDTQIEGELPQRVCTNSGCSRAKSCPFRVDCFNV
jgi:hypothetical protein